jgi:hypothetical protein
MDVLTEEERGAFLAAGIIIVLVIGAVLSMLLSRGK